jgi:hypothetical protein
MTRTSRARIRSLVRINDFAERLSMPESTNSFPPTLQTHSTARKHSSREHRTARPPSHRNNAERTPVPTPILNLQIRPRLVSIGGKRQRRNLGMGKERIMPDSSRSGVDEVFASSESTEINCSKDAPNRSKPAQRAFHNQRLMAIANHHIHAIRAPQLPPEPAAHSSR